MKKINLKKFFWKFKFVFLGAISFLGIVAVLLYLFVFNKKVDENLNIMFDEAKLIPFLENEKYGYMNAKGEKVIDANYVKVGEFFGDYSYVKIDDSKKYKILDKEGKEKLNFESEEQPKYFGNYGVWLLGNKLYDRNLSVVFEGNYIINYLSYGFFEFMNNDKNESGIVNREGKIIFKWEEDYISSKISKNDYSKNGYYALVSNYEEKEKIIDLENGKELYDLEDSQNLYIREEDDNIFRIIDRSDSFKTKTWLYCKDGKIAYKSNESIYSMSLLSHDDDILEIDYGPSFEASGAVKQYDYYNVKTGKKEEEKPSQIDKTLMEELYGYYMVSCDNNKYGIKKGSKDILACEYDEIKFLDNDLYNYLRDKKNEHLVLLKKDGNSYLYNMRKKKMVETFEKASISLSNGTFMNVVLFEDDGYTKKEVMMYNLLSKKSQKFSKDAEISVGTNYFSVKDSEKIKYYNTNLELIRE